MDPDSQYEISSREPTHTHSESSLPLQYPELMYSLSSGGVGQVSDIFVQLTIGLSLTPEWVA
jgi:hypothetical protein